MLSSFDKIPEAWQTDVWMDRQNFYINIMCQHSALLCWRAITSSSAVAKRPRDASCLSVVSFNSTKRWTESFIVSYIGNRFISACSQMRCSVVFGITLRLIVINISSSFLLSTPLLTTSETVAVVHRRPCLQHLASDSINTGSQATYWLRITISRTPPAFDAPVRGVPVVILPCHLVWNN